MPIHARIPSRPQATWPRGSGGMRARTASWPPRQDPYYGPPLYAAFGRTVVIAEALREPGHPCCVADVAAARLARPRGERSIIGRFTTNLLTRAERRP
jgi:hypothetical protein